MRKIHYTNSDSNKLDQIHLIAQTINIDGDVEHEAKKYIEFTSKIDIYSERDQAQTM